MFIISLAVADLIVGSFVMPLATIYAITEVWTMSKLLKLKKKYFRDQITGVLDYPRHMLIFKIKIIERLKLSSF